MEPGRPCLAVIEKTVKLPCQDPTPCGYLHITHVLVQHLRTPDGKVLHMEANMHIDLSVN